MTTGLSLIHISEGVQIVLLASVSGITDRYVRVSAVKGMEIKMCIRDSIYAPFKPNKSG